MVHQDGAKFLYAPAGVADVPERAPPDDIPILDGEYYVDMDRVMPCSTMLNREYGRLNTYLSYRA
ncbi:MAG: hypothetical protein HKN27_05595 [Silicimonas sp.]|nr:hypothetical protein [Silicimonas sp.]